MGQSPGPGPTPIRDAGTGGRDAGGFCLSSSGRLLVNADGTQRVPAVRVTPLDRQLHHRIHGAGVDDPDGHGVGAGARPAGSVTVGVTV